MTTGATRRGVHIDRASSAWLIGRFLDLPAEFLFVNGDADVPPEAVPVRPARGRFRPPLTGPVFDGRNEDDKRSLLLGKDPA